MKLIAIRIRAFSRILPALLLVSSISGCREAHQESRSGPVAYSGAALVARLGCAGCHPGLPAAAASRSTAGPLGPDAFRQSSDAIFDDLGGDHESSPGNPRMPDFGLADAERRALADFLAGKNTGGKSERGRELFDALNCAGCHAHDAAAAWAAGPDLRVEGIRVRQSWLRDFLRRPHVVRPAGYQPGTGTRMPDFGLSAGEADSIAAYLMTQKSAPIEAWDGSGRLTAREAETAAVLIRERYACLGCHRWQGEGGRIGPDLTRVRERLQPSYVRAMIVAPQRVAPGSSMPRIPMPAAHADLLARFLLNAEVSVDEPPDAVLPPVLPPVADAESSADLYVLHCAACHGADGGGKGYNARYLNTAPAIHASADSMMSRTDDRLYDGIHAGAYVLNGSPEMPPFGELLSNVQIRSLVAYIRRLCSCTGPAWSTDGRNPQPAAPS